MYSREASKQIRQQFWIFFGKRYPRKWMLYDTKIKEVRLKFDFDRKEAIVALDVIAPDELIRAYYFDKILQLRNILEEEVSADLLFEPDYVTESGTVISRCYVRMEGVNIHRKEDWPQVFDFFHTYMSRMETFFDTYADFIKS